MLEPRTIVTRKAGVPASIRDIIITDQSMQFVTLSTWNEFTSNECNEIKAALGSTPIITASNIKAVSYNDTSLSLSTTPMSIFTVNKDSPESKALREWANKHVDDILQVKASNPNLLQIPSTTSIANLPQLKDNIIWIQATLTIPNANQKLWYSACNKCNKSVPKDCGPSYTCSNCDSEHCQPQPRSIIHVEAHRWSSANHTVWP